MQKSKRVSTLFTDEVASVREATKGRSPRLIDLRNSALCDRYYFHQKIKFYHYSKCVEELANEFFLSQTEITKILNRQSDYLQLLRKEPPTISALRKKWKFMLWE